MIMDAVASLKLFELQRLGRNWNIVTPKEIKTKEVEFPWIFPFSRGNNLTRAPYFVILHSLLFEVWGCPAQTSAWGRKRKLSSICHFSMTFALVDACTSNQPVAQSGVSLAIRIPNLYRKILRKMSTKCVSWIKNCLSYLDSWDQLSKSTDIWGFTISVCPMGLFPLKFHMF